MRGENTCCAVIVAVLLVLASVSWAEEGIEDLFMVGFEDHWQQIGIAEGKEDLIPDEELFEDNDYWRPAYLYLHDDARNVYSITFNAPSDEQVALDEEEGGAEWAQSIKHSDKVFIDGDPGFPIDPPGKFIVNTDAASFLFEWTGSDNPSDFIVPAVNPIFTGPYGSYWNDSDKHLVINLASDDTELRWNSTDFINFQHDGDFDEKGRGRFDSILVIVTKVVGNGEDSRIHEEEWADASFSSIDLLALDEGSIEEGEKYFVLVDYTVAMTTGIKEVAGPGSDIAALQGFARGFNTFIYLEVIDDPDQLHLSDYEPFVDDNSSSNGSSNSSSSSSTCFIQTIVQ